MVIFKWHQSVSIVFCISSNLLFPPMRWVTKTLPPSAAVLAPLSHFWNQMKIEIRKLAYSALKQYITGPVFTLGDTHRFARWTHAALDVLQFGQDLQGEAVGLPPRAVSAVHEVAESQDQAEHLQHGLAGLQSLGARSAKRRQPVKAGHSRFGIFNRHRASVMTFWGVSLHDQQKSGHLLLLKICYWKHQMYCTRYVH